MNNTKKIALLLFSLISLSGFSVDQPYDVEELELVKTEEMEIERKQRNQTDNTRIYLEEGAIWATRDINTIEPQLEINATNNAVVDNNNGNLKDPIVFNVKTNYGFYVKKWKLSIYRGDDINLLAPIGIIDGEELNNNTEMTWDKPTSDYKLKSGDQLLFKLEAWDEEENIDVTTTGIIDLVHEEANFNLSYFEEVEEAKRTFGKATLMRHNIPVNSGMVKFFGTNLVGVEKVTIGKEEYSLSDEKLYAEKYLPTDRYFIPVKVLYEDQRELQYEVYVEIPERYYIQSGIADLYIGQNFVSSNDEVLNVANEYDDDFYNKGRLAYFGMAKVNDKLRVTGQIDTRENQLEDMFKDLHKSDHYSIFERVEDEDELYYPTYGDESRIRKEVNTQGKLYLDIEYDKSKLMWGNYNTGLTATEFGQYNRSLYGAKLDYRTRSTTKYGEDRLNLVGFIAEPTLLSSHDEFLGTGGSLYFLKHGDVSTGSDKVAIKLVNQTSNITEDIIYLQEGKDYEIDNYQGRIILTRPLSEISKDSFSDIIKNNPNSGYDTYLVVDYEYIPEDSDSLSDLTFGGRGRGWINNHIGVGATYVSEHKDNQDYDLNGVDVTLRATEGTYVTGEYSHSKGVQADSNFLSLDGGLNFTDISPTTNIEREGRAFRVSGIMSLYDLNSNIFSPYGNDVKVWYQEKDSGYSYASKDDNLSWKSYGTEIRYRPTNRLQLKSGYLNNVERDITGQIVTDNEEYKVQGDFAINENLTLGLELRHVEELNSGENATGDLIGAKVDYKFDSGANIYLQLQTTIDSNKYYSDNDLVTVGGSTNIGDKLKLSGEGSKGDRGYNADARLDFRAMGNYDIYVGYGIEDTIDSDKNNIIFGQRASLSDKIDVYQENQFVDENNGKGRTDSYGFDYEIIKDYRIGGSFQMGKLKKDDSQGGDTTRRRAVSVYQDVTKPKLTFKNKLEFRQDKDLEKINQYVTTNNFNYKYTDEYTVVGKLNYSRTNNRTTDKKVGEFTEASLGLAYRPIYNDNINYLTRYTYLQDEERDSNRDIDYSDERSHILEFETIYHYNPEWEFGLKLAGKDKRETFDRPSGNSFRTRTQIYLAGVKATYHVTHNWDIFGEYHWKYDKYEGALEQGAIIAVNRHIGEHFKVGVGYNFSKFTDDLRRDDYDAQGWFLNIVGKF